MKNKILLLFKISEGPEMGRPESTQNMQVHNVGSSFYFAGSFANSTGSS
jgi:hypothetical protein